MSEKYQPSPEELGITNQESESRFGDKNEIVQIMEQGTAQIKGRIEDFHKVPPHRNVVELAYVKIEQHATRNESDLVIIEDEQGHHLECVFKPVVGEDVKFHNENGLGHDYSREVASYLVSEHFGFDLVPPTVLRQIDGKIGSLQLFMPEGKYQLGDEALHKVPDEYDDQLTDSNDIKLLCIFDWIIANADRHVNNYMLKMNEQDQVEFNDGAEFIAIDNGAGFNEQFYRMKGGKSRNDLPGPYQFLTRDHISNETISTPIPEELLTIVRDGYEKRDQLTEVLLSIPDLEEKEISKMWERIEALLTTETFLSGYNYKEELAKHNKKIVPTSGT